jgi:hypothetical protein
VAVAHARRAGWLSAQQLGMVMHGSCRRFHALASAVSEVGLLSLPKKRLIANGLVDCPLLRNAKVDDAFVRSTGTRGWGEFCTLL